MLTRVASSARTYLDRIQDRAVARRPEAVARLDELFTSLAENGMDVQEILNTLITVVEPAWRIREARGSLPTNIVRSAVGWMRFQALMRYPVFRTVII